MTHTVETQISGRAFSLETGKVAKQADGAVVVRPGGTMVLATCVAARSVRESQDFFPLTVEYRERAYAGGRIPGGYFKREGAPVMKETLTCRLIDRPIRPLFPDGFRNEVQVICLVISGDQDNDPDVLAMNGASAALGLSGMPFDGPVGAVRVGYIDGRFVTNPTTAEQAASSLELVIAGTEEAVLMVEAGAREVPEETMLEAIAHGHAECQRLVRVQRELIQAAGKPRWAFDPDAGRDASLEAEVRRLVGVRLERALTVQEKQARAGAVGAVLEEVIGALATDDDRKAAVRGAFERVEAAEVRRLIVDRGLRVDGRRPEEIRPISIEVPFLPRAHGSTLFTRGETQALVAVALGTSMDEQRMDNIQGMEFKKFMLHYNFPPFSVGETSMRLFPGRREIGHGFLAERSVAKVLPKHEAFPYTIRIVSDTLESNGSSSMASVCGATLCLMDAGVPIAAPVAGIAMGLIKEGTDVAVLSDILGDEDHLGDMDFKVTGTANGVAALQMDIKITGVDRAIMKQALEQAKAGRIHILGKMAEAIAAPRPELSPYAPRITTIYVKPDQVRTVIGSGGKNIRGIIEATGCSIDIEDDGKINIASADGEACKKAIKMIRDLTQEATVGKLYLGTVRKVMEFGAFVEIFPGTDGLVHVSELDTERVRNVTDILKEGDQVLVKCIGIDKQGKIKLSRKEALGQTLPSEG